jgi:hypothetical protein
MSDHKGIVLGDQDLDPISRKVVENGIQWPDVGSKDDRERKVQRSADEKTCIRYETGMTPKVSDTSTTGIMVMREKD